MPATNENIPLLPQQSVYNPDYTAPQEMQQVPVYPSVPAYAQQNVMPQQQYYAKHIPSAPYQQVPIQPAYHVPTVIPTQVSTVQPANKSSQCGCCSCLIALLALIVAIVAMSLSSVSMSSLTALTRVSSAQRFFSVQNSYTLRSSASNRYTINAYSLLSNGQVAMGYGFSTQMKGSIPKYSNYGFNPQDTHLAHLGPNGADNHYAVIVRANSQRMIIATSVSATNQNQYLYRITEVTYTPKVARMTKVLAIVNINHAKTSSSGKFIVVFETELHAIYAVSATVNYGGSFTFDNNEFLVRQPTESSISFVNATAIPIADGAFALMSSVNLQSPGMPKYTALSICQVSSNSFASCYSESSSRSCYNSHTLIPFNGTTFFSMCDFNMYKWNINLQSKILNPTSQSTSMFPSVTNVLGAYFTAKVDNSTFLVSYVDNQKNLKAVLGTISSPYKYMNDYYSVRGNNILQTIDTNVNPLQPVRFVMVENYMGFFIYNNLQNEFIAKPVSIVANEEFYALSVSKQRNIVLNNTNSLVKTPMAIAFNEDQNNNAGLFVFSGLSEEYDPIGIRPNNEFRYYQVYGSLNVIGIAENQCTYYRNYQNCQVNLAHGGTFAQQNSRYYYGMSLYAGSEYYASPTGEITVESSANTQGDEFKFTKVGVAASTSELFVRIDNQH